MQVTLDTVFVCEPGMGVIQGGALVELDRFFDENWVPVNFDGCANIPPSVNAGGHVYFEAIGFDSSEAFEFVFDDLEDEGIFLVSPS